MGPYNINRLTFYTAKGKTFGPWGDRRSKESVDFDVSAPPGQPSHTFQEQLTLVYLSDPSVSIGDLFQLKHKSHVIIVIFKVETILQKETNYIYIFLYLFCETPSTAERETHDGQTNTFRSNKLIFSGVPYT